MRRRTLYLSNERDKITVSRRRRGYAHEAVFVLPMVGECSIDVLGQRSNGLLSFFTIQLIHFRHHFGDRLRVDATRFIQIAPDETG